MLGSVSSSARRCSQEPWPLFKYASERANPQGLRCTPATVEMLHKDFIWKLPHVLKSTSWQSRSTMNDRLHLGPSALRGYSLVIQPQASECTQFFAATGAAWSSVNARGQYDAMPCVGISDRRIHKQ